MKGLKKVFKVNSLTEIPQSDFTETTKNDQVNLIDGKLFSFDTSTENLPTTTREETLFEPRVLRKNSASKYQIEQSSSFVNNVIRSDVSFQLRKSIPKQMSDDTSRKSTSIFYDLNNSLENECLAKENQRNSCPSIVLLNTETNCSVNLLASTSSALSSLSEASFLLLSCTNRYSDSSDTPKSISTYSCHNSNCSMSELSYNDENTFASYRTSPSLDTIDTNIASMIPMVNAYQVPTTKSFSLPRRKPKFKKKKQRKLYACDIKHFTTTIQNQG